MRKGLKTVAVGTSTLSLFAATTSLGFAQSYSPSYNNYNYTNRPAQQRPSYAPQQSYNQQQSYMPALQGRVVLVPSGTTITTYVSSPISSEQVYVGDSITVNLGSDFYYNGVLVAPSGSVVNGTVVIAEKAGLTGKNGKLKLKFTNIITPNGQRIPISGKLVTADGSGILVGGTTKDRAMSAAKNAAGGAALGALAGTIFGPISGGKVGKGAALGTAVGGGLGLGKTLINRGNEAALDSGSSVEIMLDQPLSVNPSQTYGY